jgi:hypothetical protein
METGTPPYLPELIEEHATELYARAHTARLAWTTYGALVGGLLAAPALIAPTPLPLAARFGLCALAALAAAFAGRRIGGRRAAALRVRGQLTLCHVHAQYGTLAVWRTLQERLPAAAPARERATFRPTGPEVAPEIAERVAAAVAAAAEPTLPRAAGDA